MKNLYKFLSIGLLAIFIISCIDIDQAISLAESAITQAKLVGAIHYAKDDLTTAQTKVKSARNGKENDKKVAYQSAIDAISFANKAYYTTLRLRPLKEATITSNTQNNADSANAALLAKDTYDQAVSEFNKARDIFQQIIILSNKLNQLEPKTEVKK